MVSSTVPGLNQNHLTASRRRLCCERYALFRIDDGGALPHDVADGHAQQRVVGAAEYDGVGVMIDKGLDEACQHLAHADGVQSAGLDLLRKPWAGLGDDSLFSRETRCGDI